MNFVQLIEGLDYPQETQGELPQYFKLTVEICSRLQELDEILPTSAEHWSGGLRFISRITAISRKSPRAYRLLLDMLSSQESFSMSIEELASRHFNSNGIATSRQSWLQNAQHDIEIIKLYWSEVGEVMEELLKRRPEAEQPHK